MRGRDAMSGKKLDGNAPGSRAGRGGRAQLSPYSSPVNSSLARTFLMQPNIRVDVFTSVDVLARGTSHMPLRCRAVRLHAGFAGR